MFKYKKCLYITDFFWEKIYSILFVNKDETAAIHIKNIDS